MAQFLPIESSFRKQGFNLIAGFDEAGRGPLAGPVVSAAVILKAKARLPGLNDSKKLSALKRAQLFEMILANCLDYAIAAVSHITIDTINILNATKLANELCLGALTIKPDLALVDGRDKQNFNIPFYTIIKGDSKVRCIAAASILAKVARDKIMIHYSKEYPSYGFEAHKGYGTRKHRANILNFGFCEIHRKTYTVKPLV